MASMAWDRATAGEQDPNLHLLSGTDGRRGDDDCKERVIAEGPPTLVGAGVFLVALIVAVPFLFRTASGPTYTPAAGIAAFALFYIVAQAAERVVEFLLPLLGKLFNPMEKSSKVANRDVVKVAAEDPGQPATTAQDAANAQAAVDQVVANRRIIAFAMTAALGMLLCSYLEADFLTAVGVKFDSDPWWAQVVQVAVTGLVVGGGSVGVHDLIGNITKSSKAKDDPGETGGTK
jgi:hypothetical protein